MKKGLILEGGAMRGMFTAGVIDVMMENNIEYDAAIGVSAGAVFGCNYKSKQIGRVIRYNSKFCNDKRYYGIRCLLTDGNIYSAKFCYGEVPLKYDLFNFDTYHSNPMDFYAVCTDIETGKPVYKNCKKFENHNFDWLRASASMPLVSQIVKIDGYKLLDGGIADSIPVKYFESIGFNKNIVVLTQPKGYVKEKNSLISLMKIKYRKYPKLIEAMTNRHIMYNDTIKYIEEKEKNGELYVIRPESNLPISRTEKDPKKLRAVYEIGRKVATEKIEEIKKFLNSAD